MSKNFKQNKKRFQWRWLGVAGTILALLLAARAVWAATSASMLASRDPSGTPGDSYSYSSVISYDARYIAFHSLAQNIDPLNPDTDNFWDIFIYDRDSDGNGTFDNLVLATRITQGSTGDSRYPSMPRKEDLDIDLSGVDGRYVVFQSSASDFGAYNWVAPHDTENDPGPNVDIFLYDRDAFSGTGGIFSISKPFSDGTNSNGASGSPGRIPFSIENPVHAGADIYLDSTDAPFVVYESIATNLISGTLAHWNGSTWANSTSPTNSTLYGAVRAPSSTDIWAVGEQGMIVLYHSSSWSILSSPTTENLYAISMVSAAEGWAVGANGTILHYNDPTWSLMTSPTTSDLKGVSFLSGASNDGYAVGVGGVIIHWNGSAWSTVTSPTATNLNAVAMIATSNVLAVGDGGVTLRWNGTLWSTLTSPTTNNLYGVARWPSGTNAFAVGDAGTIMRWNSVNWTILTPSPTTTNRFTSISMFSSGDGWAVGTHGTFYHWNGSSWTAAASPTANTLYAAATNIASDAWAVGEGGSNGRQHIYLRNVNYARTSLLTRNAANDQANGDSTNPVVTGNGRFLAFVSYATNLVSGVSGLDGIKAQVYLLDRDADTDSIFDEFNNPGGVRLYLVSRVPSGAAGNGDSWSVDAVEADGVVRVVFSSSASNLIAGDTNGFRDIFMGEVNPSTQTQTIQRISNGYGEEQGNNVSLSPSISGDGTVIAFTSYATNLIPFDSNSDCYQDVGGVTTLINCPDIFGHELIHNVTWRASLTGNGREAESDSGSPRLSGNGQFVSFTTRAQLTGTGSEGIHHQIYIRDQGIPAGNPVISPSSWDFPLTQTGETNVKQFTLTFLGTLIINGEISIDDTSHDPTKFAILMGDTCSNQSFPNPDPDPHTCTFYVEYHPGANDAGRDHNAIISIPVNDSRGELFVALTGSARELNYIPLSAVP